MPEVPINIPNLALQRSLLLSLVCFSVGLGRGVIICVFVCGLHLYAHSFSHKHVNCKERLTYSPCCTAHHGLSPWHSALFTLCIVSQQSFAPTVLSNGRVVWPLRFGSPICAVSLRASVTAQCPCRKASTGSSLKGEMVRSGVCVFEILMYSLKLLLQKAWPNLHRPPAAYEEATRRLTSPGSASPQVPGRGGLHRHHPGHAVQARALFTGPLVGAQRGHGAQRRGPQGHAGPRGTQRRRVAAGETDRGADQEVSPWVWRVHPCVPSAS